MTLTASDKAALLRRYSERLLQYGPTDEALGWTKPKQALRYRILLDYWLSPPPQPPLRVLDFGCGFGDLFGYARERGFNLNYTGLDINERLVQVARERYPEARFICLDASKDSLTEKFDVVLSSGVHNHRLDNNSEFLEYSFELFDQISTLGFAANFLSDRVNFRTSENNYSAPEDVLALALRYSRRVGLRHDYMPFEFSIFVDKRAEIDEKLTVFLPFVADCVSG